MHPPQPGGAAQRILHHLKTKGPASAAELAETQGVTPVAIRMQLKALEQEGLVRFEDEAGRVGRPRRIWRLAGRAEAVFPDNHVELALGMLAAVRSAFGEDGVDRMVAERTRAQVDSYKGRMPAARAALEERVSSLAAIRREEGYMASWRKLGRGRFELVENHCPICAAAKSCAGLCRGELELFRSVLGPDVAIERVEHILDGSRRCVYRIGP